MIWTVVCGGAGNQGYSVLGLLSSEPGSQAARHPTNRTCLGERPRCSCCCRRCLAAAAAAAAVRPHQHEQPLV
jgi:hypothetical protein